MALSFRIDEAFHLAHELHRHQVRKGSAVPYITHLMSVAALVGEHGGDEEQMTAALLHDAVEDQGGAATRERIREQFGDRVVRIIDECSDTDVEPKPPWRERKEAHLSTMAEMPAEAKLVLAADKLHNARTILMDLRSRGEALWDIFSGKREGTLWYYREVAAALRTNWEHPILDALDEAIDLMHEMAATHP